MDLIISAAIILVLVSSVAILVAYRKTRLTGSDPVALFTFIAILFTSGLDVGLIMFPLTEFPVYETEAAYDFAHPVAIMFGCWGFLVWSLYFLTTFYFLALEPRLKLFEIPWVKAVNNLVIIGTCAFTGYLFLFYLPSYIEGISPLWKYALVAVVVLLSVLSSTNIKFVKVLSVTSLGLFSLLAITMWVASGMSLGQFVGTLSHVGDYFSNIHRFVTPISDHHAFYLFWWFAWSIMIGQFVARFVRNMGTWGLMLALLILPSIPLAVWFTVIYFYHTQSIEIAGAINLFMILVGVIFVLNSLDSLTRLYTDNLKLSVKRLGMGRYVIFNWTLLFGLILLYQFTPLQIEWIGLVVIGLYLAVYGLIFRHRRTAFAPLLQAKLKETQ